MDTYIILFLCKFAVALSLFFFLAVFADLHTTANPVYYTIRLDRDGHNPKGTITVNVVV